METIIIGLRDRPSIVVPIQDYVNILTDPVRWEIIRLLDREPLDVELISSMLYKKRVTDRPVSRQAIVKHIQQLLKIGVIMKKTGLRNMDYMIREGIRGRKSQVVSLYTVVPEGIETVLRSLNTLSNYDVRVELKPKVQRAREDYEEFVNSFHRTRVLSGGDTGRFFRLRKDSVRIGRIDPEKMDEFDPQHDIGLSSGYVAVSRVWRPHARLLRQGTEWFVEHCEGRNGTYLENRRLEKNERARLEHRSVISLATGHGSARLVFLLPESAGAQ